MVILTSTVAHWSEHMFRVGAFAIIFDAERKVLLCHRRDIDIWNLPGGEVESRELPTEAVVRETREETGLEVKVDRLVGVYGKPDKDELVFAFLCSVMGGEITESEEADDCRYFDLERLPVNTSPKQAERIVDALDSSRPIFRRQTAKSTEELLKELGLDQ